MDYYEIGDTIHGSKIYVESRKIEGYRVTSPRPEGRGF